MVNKMYRKCQGCGKVLDRETLIKITLFDGKLYLNPSSKILGRSMYICPDVDCVKNVIKKKRIYSALKFKNFEEISSMEAKLLELTMPH